MRIRQRRMAGGIAAILLTVGLAVVNGDPVFDGYGMFTQTAAWTPNPTTKVATVWLDLHCWQGHTCGTAKISIDWDDGNVTTVYSSLPFAFTRFDHEYGDNGLRHVKVTAEDDDEFGNWFSMQPIDITINN